MVCCRPEDISCLTESRLQDPRMRRERGNWSNVRSDFWDLRVWSSIRRKKYSSWSSMYVLGFHDFPRNQIWLGDLVLRVLQQPGCPWTGGADGRPWIGILLGVSASVPPEVKKIHWNRCQLWCFLLHNSRCLRLIPPALGIPYWKETRPTCVGMTAAETSMLSTYEESRVACLPCSLLNYGLEELARALVKQFLRAQRGY